MRERQDPRSTAVLAMFLSFAAVLLAVAPAESSIPRDGVASALPQIHETAPESLLVGEDVEGVAEFVTPFAPAFKPCRFTLAHGVSLLRVENAPGAFSLTGPETNRCERTYARNNPLRFVDRDGRSAEAAVLTGLGSAFNIPAPPPVLLGAAAGIGGFAVGRSIGKIEIAGIAIDEHLTRLFTGVIVGPEATDDSLLLQPLQRPKTVEEMAKDLSQQIGKNSVPFGTITNVGHIDLQGEAHYDKATGQKIPTPHVQERKKNVGPNGQVNLGQETTRPATKQDIRTARKLAEEQGLLP